MMWYIWWLLTPTILVFFKAFITHSFIHSCLKFSSCYPCKICVIVFRCSASFYTSFLNTWYVFAIASDHKMFNEYIPPILSVTPIQTPTSSSLFDLWPPNIVFSHKANTLYFHTVHTGTSSSSLKYCDTSRKPLMKPLQSQWRCLTSAYSYLLITFHAHFTWNWTKK